MTTYSWATVRDRLTRSFRAGPTAVQEEAIIEAFQQRPGQIVAIGDRLAERFAQGKLNYPWGALVAEAKRLTSASSIVAEDVNERQAKVDSAEAWLRNAGSSFDREDEVEDELFGERGMLRQWRDDDELRERML